jgi:hypothetical protein
MKLSLAPELGRKVGMKVGRDPAGGLGLAKGLQSSDALQSDCRIAETVVP